MSWPPPGVDFALAENVALTTIRQLAGIPLGWGEMLASSQTVISHTDDRAFGDPVGLFDQSTAAPVIAAARILDAAADPRSHLAEDERLNAAAQAVVAFGMHGNFASAAAVARREGLLGLVRSAVSPAMATALATCLPNHVSEFLALVDDDGPEAAYLGSYVAFLSTGSEERVEELRGRLTTCIKEGDPSDFFGSALLRQAGLALEQTLVLSVPRVLTGLGVLPSEVLHRLVEKGYTVFLPPQYRGIVEKHLLTSDHNSMIALPTSTGKTLLGSLCLLSALREEPGLVCYVTPWVATARQAADSLQRIKSSSTRLLRLMGGFDELATVEPYDYAEIVVATPERFDALLRGSPEVIPALRAVVFDEAHLVESAARGVRLEGVIGRLRMLQDRGHSMRLIFTSAVLATDDAVRTWLGVADDDALLDSWRPTARRVARWAQSGRLEWFTGDDPIRRSGTEATSVIGYADVPWPEPRINATGTFQGVLAQEPLVRENIAYLAEWVSQRLGHPMLFVCATKAQTREVAAAIADRLPEAEPIPQGIAAIRARIDDRYPFLRPLRDLLLHRVAFHNSTVPHDVRQLIEEAVAHRDIRAVAATTTLAEGVDLPFRVTVIVDWLMWGDAGRRPMSPTLFANIAGRAGRAGSFTDGDTILYDNPLGDPLYTHPRRRDAVQATFLLSETLPSLLSAFESAEDPEREELVAALASQYLAAIPENPDEAALAETFGRHTLVGARANGRAELISELIDSIEAELVDPEAGAFAVAASPLQLTPLGEAANHSGFSPQSVRRIISVLHAEQPEIEIAHLGAFLLRNLGTLPEQPNEKVKQVLTRSTSRYWVKPADFEDVIRGWVNARAVQELFVDLPIVGRSTISPPVDEWLSGATPGPKWDAQFDTFVDFTASTLSGFLPWLMRACETLSGVVGGWSQAVPWRDWAERIEAPENAPEQSSEAT